MAVTERDIEYFRRIGEYKRRSHEDALRDHLALTLDERLQRSWELAIACAAWGEAPEDDPTPFYDRARELGLYKP